MKKTTYFHQKVYKTTNSENYGNIPNQLFGSLLIIIHIFSIFFKYFYLVSLIDLKTDCMSQAISHDLRNIFSVVTHNFISELTFLTTINIKYIIRLLVG